jgi:hypothetical protein
MLIISPYLLCQCYVKCKCSESFECFALKQCRAKSREVDCAGKVKVRRPELLKLCIAKAYFQD